MKNLIPIVFAILTYPQLLNAQKDTVTIAANVKSPGKTIEEYAKEGRFTTLRANDGKEYRGFIAGPQDAKMGILFVHDYFGITHATKESVNRLGALGYLTLVVDLYNGKSATTNDAAEALMKAKNSDETTTILKAGIAYLTTPERKLAAIGFSAGGIDAMNATLLRPELFDATIIVYGGGYDGINKSSLAKLENPILAITGSLDNWPLQAALNFLTQEKDKLLELHVYPGVDHGYAQPLFNGGKNYSTEATRVTWLLIEDFLFRQLGSNQ